MIRRIWGADAFIVLCAVSAAGWAQTPAPAADTGALDEIVVTARKTSESLQKAPASITAVPADALSSGGINVPTDLDKALPSATLRQEGAVAQTFIRGVGSNLDFPWTSPDVAITYNGILIPRYGTMGILFDLSSVQMIAGPQGTLYGGSASGGAINLITEKPSNDYAGNALLEGGNYSTGHAALNQNVSLSEHVSLQTSLDYNRHSGYESNGLFSSNRLEGRESLLYTPSDDLTALFFASGYREKGAMPNASSSNVKPRPADPWYVPPVGAGGQPLDADQFPVSLQTYVIGANVDWHLGDAFFTYIPGYVRVKDTYDFIVFAGALDGGVLHMHNAEAQISQELRWSQQFGDWKLSAGLFWLRNRTDFRDGIGIAVLPAALGYYLQIPVLDEMDQTKTSYSGFGQAVYSVNDQLRFTIGARESQDKINSDGTGGGGAFSFNRNQAHTDWKVGVDYDLTPTVLLYGNIQTGYVPFGYNPDVGNPASALPESKLLAFSAGFKSRMLENRLEINSEIYYYDYKDFQAFQFDQVTHLSQVSSARKSVIYGDELTIRWIPLERTKLEATIVGQNARYTDFSGIGYDYDNYQMADSPKWNVTLGLQHEVDLGNSGSLTGRVSTQYNNGSWGVFNHQGTFQTPYTRTDVVLTYAPPKDQWRVQAFVNNTENSRIWGGLGATVPGQPGAGDLAAPRTFGVRITSSWN